MFMLNNHVISFYDNFGLISKGLEDKATIGIENWFLLSTPLLIVGSSSHENCNDKPYIAGN